VHRTESSCGSLIALSCEELIIHTVKKAVHAEHQAEGVRMPEGMPLDELALRVLIAAETGQLPR
jgi:hypothetical protein